MSPHDRVPGLRSVKWAFFAILALALVEGFRYRNWYFDDSYIYLRLVGNLARGTWGYNLGQVYNCSTSPVYPVVLLLASGFGRLSAFGVAHVLGTVGIAAFGLSAYALLESRGRVVALLGGLAGVEVLARNNSWGLELQLAWGLVGLVLVAASRAYRAGRGPSPTLGIALGLLVLARPDFVVFDALLLICWSLALPREAGATRPFLVASGIAALTVLPWAAFSYHTFGQLFPATLAAKRWQGASGLWGSGHLLYIVGFRTYWGSGVGVPKVVYLVGLVGGLALIRARHPLTPLFLFCAVQQTVYFLLNVPGYSWYYESLDVCGLLGTAYLTSSIVSAIRARTRGEAWAGNGVVRACLVAIGAALVASWGIRPVGPDGRERGYRGAAEEIVRLSAGRSRSIAAVEVGFIGYFSGLPMVDLCGLTTPNLPFLVPANMDAYFAQPADYLLLHKADWPHERAMRADPRFHETYAGPFSASEGINALDLYARKGLPMP